MVPHIIARNVRYQGLHIGAVQAASGRFPSIASRSGCYGNGRIWALAGFAAKAAMNMLPVSPDGAPVKSSTAIHVFKGRRFVLHEEWCVGEAPSRQSLQRGAFGGASLFRLDF